MANFAKDMLDNKAFLKGMQTFATDASKGGQFGYMYDMANYIDTSPYVRQHAFAFLIQYPKAFDLYPADIRDLLVRMLKAMIEVNPKQITGLNSTLATDWMTVEVGGAGEIFQQLTNVTRERAAPSFTWHEVEGCVYGRYLEWYIEYLGMSADSKFPNIVAEGFEIGPLLADMTRFVTLFVEPNHTGRRAVDAILCANMFPMGAGPRESERDQTAAKQGRDIQVEFTALSQRTRGVLQLGQKFLDALNVTGMNPLFQPAVVDTVDANIQAQANGMSDQVTRLGKQSVVF